MFPMASVPDIIHATSEQLLANNQAPLSKMELFQFLGVLIYMSLFQFGSKRSWWSTTNQPPRPNIESMCGMTRHRFEGIMSNLRLVQFTPDEELANPWIPIDDFVNAFNARRQRVIVAGFPNRCALTWVQVS